MKLIPKGAQKLNRKELAYGEVTGHSHSIADVDSAYLLEHGDDLYMVVREQGDVEITHQEHAPHFIPPGECQIIPQVETTFWGKQRVID